MFCPDVPARIETFPRLVWRARLRRTHWALWLFAWAGLATTHLPAEGLQSNSWVRPSPTGNLVYRHDESGVRTIDYSACGYRSGIVELPDVNRLVEAGRWIRLAPGGGGNVIVDDADLIQNALNAAGQATPNGSGFRGVVFLAPGDYRVGRTLVISNSGVVLKGSGFDQSTGSRIWATNLVQHTLLQITGPGSWQTEARSYALAQPLVPAGTRTFKLFDTNGLTAGQSVVVTRPFTAGWISEINMDRLHTVICPPNLPNVCFTNGLNEDWSTEWTQTFLRRIARLDGPWVTVDSPLPQTFDHRYGGGYLQRVTADPRLQNIGVEDVFLGSYYRPTNFLGQPSTADEQHAWRAVEVTQAQDVWIRRITGRHFGFATVDLREGSSHVTVAECRSIDPISKITGDRRYAFHMDKGDHNLIRDCTSDEGRHDFAFSSRVPGPNANVRSRATDTHADCGPHQKWSVGGLYDLIDVEGTWWSEFIGRVGINVQNRGRNSTGHGWTGAYMSVWNCQADVFRVRNPPTARNWLIGSIGSVLDSQWWLPPVGDDPEGTYEWAGPFYPPAGWPPTPPTPQSPLGRHVNPYSLYFAQLQQRLKWPASEFRETWIGDVDDFGRVDSPDDVAPLDDTFLGELRAIAGNLPVTRFLDRLSPTQQIACTFTVPLAAPARVVAASLVLCVKATGPAAPDDALFLDSTNAIPLRLGGLGWDLRANRPTIETIEIDPALLGDGRLNVALKRNVALDWAVLHTQVTPLATTAETLPLFDDTYARGGSHKQEVHGFETEFVVKNEDDGDNSRRGYILWRLAGLPTNAVGATVRLFCTGRGQPGNVYGVALTPHDDWGERSLTWQNQPGALPAFAYVVPEPGQWVEFSVLPALNEALASDRRLGLQLWAPYDLGDAGWAGFASRQHPDTNLHPRLIVQFANTPPMMTTVTNQAMDANAVLGPVAVTVGDPETPTTSLLLTATSSNPTLLPNQGISIAMLGSGRFLTFTPSPNRTGVTEITLSLNDGAQTVVQSFLLRVGPPTAPPGLSFIPDQVLNEDVASVAIPFTVTNQLGAGGDLSVTFNSFSFSRVPTLNFTLGSLDASNSPSGPISQRFVVITPAANYAGSNVVTVQVSDGFQSIVRSFGVRVTPVNDPPGPIQLNDPADDNLLPGQPILLVASIVDFERDLARVEFRLNGSPLGAVTNPPYRFTWTNPPAGVHRLTAAAFDQVGQSTESPPIFYLIGQEPDYEAPPQVSIQATGDVVTVLWDTDGRDMQLQITDRLGTGATWQDVTTSLGTATGNSATFVTTNGAHRYFRLRELR